MQELNDKLSFGMAEYSRLKQVFHEYQAKSAEKVGVNLLMCIKILLPRVHSRCVV